MNINFEYYKVFYIIAKNKNITKAAKELNISQPAISRMLKTMEEQMNTKLFIRKSKGVLLTQEGNELYKLISTEINHILKAENTFNKIINHKTLKVAVNKTYLNYLVNNQKLDNLLKNNTSIDFINSNDFDLLNHQLVDNLIDFAIITEPTYYQFSDNLKFKKIEELHFILVSNSKEDCFLKKQIVLQESDKQIIQISKEDRKNCPLEKTITVDDYDNMFPFIYNGYASGFVIKEFIHNELKNGIVYQIPTSQKIPSISIGILYNVNNEIKIENYFKDIK